MKHFFTITFLLVAMGFFLYSPEAEAQDKDADEIALSIKAGSSRELSSFFDEEVQLTIIGNEGDYSKNQAELVIKDFFKKFPPVDFEIVHRGKSGTSIAYFIGTYQSNSLSFRMLIKCKKDKNDNNIYAIDITKE
ncbi:DUF4783 domain-containing protein [Echinicola pacifica]|nr:DUF4783 domain-containing protein [Echinicola pacifica]